MEDILKYRKEFVSPKGGCVEYAILNVNIKKMGTEFYLDGEKFIRPIASHPTDK